METYATVKGQIVIPAELRRKHGIKAGTKITFIDTDDAIIIKPITEETIKRMRGALKGKGLVKALLDERRQDVEREG
jgi:AbrB family looped-hinge helix DNA binding protein